MFRNRPLIMGWGQTSSSAKYVKKCLTCQDRSNLFDPIRRVHVFTPHWYMNLYIHIFVSIQIHVYILF